MPVELEDLVPVEKAKKTRGRKPKLTEDRFKLIINLISQGNFVDTAVRAAGISDTSYYAWLDRGRKQPNSIYGEFLEAVEVATAKAEVVILKRVMDASKEGAWQAAAWYLERTRPEKFGRKNLGEGSQAPRITVNNMLDLRSLGNLTDERLAIINDNLRRAVPVTQVLQIEGNSGSGWDSSSSGDSDFGTGPTNVDDYQ